MANYRDAKDLAAGIHWVLEEADRENLKKECIPAKRNQCRSMIIARYQRGTEKKYQV